MPGPSLCIPVASQCQRSKRCWLQHPAGRAVYSFSIRIGEEAVSKDWVAEDGELATREPASGSLSECVKCSGLDAHWFLNYLSLKNRRHHHLAAPLGAKPFLLHRWENWNRQGHPQARDDQNQCWHS